MTTNPIPPKYALRKVGFDVGSVRPPLAKPEPSQAAVVDAALASAQIDLPIPAAV